MTQFTLSATTQSLINMAVAAGPGINNINYYNAYNAISNDLAANGNVDSGVTYWFSQAGSINSYQYSTAPTPAAVFIWNYTKAAVASEGGTTTNDQMQTASNKIASTVFQQLQQNNFVFNDQNTTPINFAPTSIVTNDAGAGFGEIQSDNSVPISYAAWGGTLFAQTALADPTYSSDYHLNLSLGSQDCKAIFNGLDAAAVAEYNAGNVMASILPSVLNLDTNVLEACSLPPYWQPSSGSTSSPTITVTPDGSGAGNYDININGTAANGGTFTNSMTYNATGDSWSAIENNYTSTGQVAVQTTFNYSTSNNSLTTDSQGMDSSGNVVYQQTTSVGADGNESASIAGTDDVASLSDTAITFSNGATGTVEGNGNNVILSSDAAAILDGANNAATLSNNNSVTVADAGTSVNFVTDAVGNVTATSGSATTTFSSGTVTNITTDSSGDVAANLANLEPSSGLSQSVNLNGNSASVDVGGSAVYTSQSGGTITDTAGVLSETSTPTSGWTQTFDVGTDGTVTQTATTGSGSGAITLTDNLTGSSPTLSSLGLDGSDYTGSGSVSSFVDSTLSTADTSYYNTYDASQSSILSTDLTDISTDQLGSLSPALQALISSDASDIAIDQDDEFSDDDDLADDTDIDDYQYFSDSDIPAGDGGIGDGDVSGDGAIGDGDGAPGDGGTGDGGVVGDGDGDGDGGPDPLVLGLKGKGINLLSVAQSGVEYDFTGGGNPQSVGWVGANTGFLVLLNAQGQIISNSLTFSSLAALDSNGDGVINASDAAYADLAVWVGGNGTPGSGTLYSLSQLGITSIGTGSTAANVNVGGNTITATGTFTFSDGTTQAIDQVTLADLTSSGIRLNGTSAAALAFTSRVAQGGAAQAKGVVTADKTSLASAISALTAPASTLAHDEATFKPTLHGEALSASVINTTQTTASDGLYDYGAGQLWETNGTTLTELKSSNIDASEFTQLGNEELFEGIASDNSLELFETNGTTVTQLTTGDNLSIKSYAQIGNGKDLFVSGTALWVTDGTAGGTTEILNTGAPGTEGMAPKGFTNSLNNGLELFEARDSAGRYQLYATNGTAAGTVELTTSTYGPSGINLNGMYALGDGEDLFLAVNNSGYYQLWSTNGTKTGTIQLTNYTDHDDGVSIKAITPAGNGEAFFAATSSNGQQLWETNGTTITELTNLVGFNPTDITSLGNGSVLFAGVYNGLQQLWISNGTAAGTTQLTSLTYTGNNGGTFGVGPSTITSLGNGTAIFSGYNGHGDQLWSYNGTTVTQILSTSFTNTLGGTTGATPTGFTSLGNGEELFAANNSNKADELWVTNGTASGTVQLTSTLYTNNAGNPAGTNPTGFVSLGNGEELFEGNVSADEQQLWVTNGTLAGTHQLTTVAYNDGSQGTFGVDPSSFISLGNGKEIFEGLTNGGEKQVWVTNGTAAGTFQLTTVAYADGSQGTFGADPTGFVSLGNGEALFEGINNSGTEYIWATDGTTAGTHTLSAASGIVLETDMLQQQVNTVAAPAAVQAAETAVVQALQAASTASQNIISATSDQMTSDNAALTADAESALIGSNDDVTAQTDAATTAGVWQAALSSLVTAYTDFQSANSSVSSAQAVVNSLSGATFASTYDAQEAADTAALLQTTAQSLAIGEVDVQSLLSSIATALNASRATLVTNGQSVTAAGGDLVVLAPGSETVSDGSTPSTYAVLQGANVQISNFHSGVGGSVLNFLSGASNAVFTAVSNGTQITVGSSTVTLVGVNISALSLFDNVTGVQNATFNGSGAGVVNGASGTIEDMGSTHIVNLSFGSGGNQTIAGGAGNNTYTFASGDGVDVINNGVSSNIGASGQLDLSGIAANNLVFSQSGSNLVISVKNSSDQVTVNNWFTNAYADLDAVQSGDGVRYSIVSTNELLANNTSGTSQAIFVSPSVTEIETFSGTNGSGTVTSNVYDYAASNSAITVASNAVDNINGVANIITGTSTTINVANATSSTDADQLNVSDSTVNIQNSVFATVAGTNDTINVAANATVTASVNNSTIYTQAADSTSVNGYDNNIIVTQNDPLSISGFGNTVTIAGSSADITDDTLSSNNSFTIQSGSTGNTLALSGADDVVSDSGSGNTITTLGGGDTLAAGSNDTLSLTGSNVVSGSAAANLATDTLAFDDQSIAGNFTSGSAAADGLNYTLHGSTLTVADASDTLTVDNFTNGEFGVDVTVNYVPPVAETDNINANYQPSVSGNVLADNGNGPDTDPNGLALSTVAETITTTEGGTFTLDTDGSFTYTAATGYRGNDTATYTLEDSVGLTATGTVDILNAFTDHPPATVLETVDAANSATASGNVLTSDSDPDGDAINAVAQTVTTADGGTVTIATNGAFTYTAASGLRGNDSFVYTAEDVYGATTAGTVDVDNVFTNRAPTAVAETVNASQQSSVSGNVLTGNTDPDGDTVSAVAQTITTTNGNTVTTNADGSFTIQAASGFRGADSFTYTDEDSYGAESSGTVTVNNLFTNRAPVTVLQVLNANDNATVSGNVLANDSDPDGDVISAIAQTLTTANGGTVTVVTNGSFTYTAATGFRGNDSFVYTAEDVYGATSGGTVDLNNIFTNRAPTTVAETFNASQQGSISGNVLTNDSDPDGDAINAVAQTVTTADGGTVAIATNGAFTYTAASGFRGNDSFVYTAEDVYGATTAGTVDIDNVFTNRAPTAIAETVNASEQSSASGNVLSGNSDPDGDTVSAVAQTITTANGNAVTINADGSFTIQAASGFRGTDSFTYTDEDSYGAESSNTVTVNNLFTNRAPVTVLETVNANDTAAANGNVLANDSDPDGDGISAVTQTLTTTNGGTVTIATNGAFTYTAATGFRGNDSFNYTAEDSYGATTVGTVDLNNVLTNRAPVTVLETVGAANTATANGNVLANDSDPDGDAINAVAQTVTTADGGTVTIATNGAFTYTAASGLRGNDSFVYTAEDVYGATTAGTVDVDNVFTNRAPTANAETFNAAQQSSASGNVLSGNSDPDGDTFSAVAQTVTTANGNTVTVNANGSFTIQAATGFRGTDSFTYTDEDSYGAESTGTVTVNSLFTNHAPVTALETVNANSHSSVSGNVLTSDSDPDGDAISAVAQTVTTVDGGTVTLSSNGSFTYTAATGFRGNDSFTYTAEDSYGATTAGTVDITNVFTNRAPTAVAETFNAGNSSTASGNVLTANSDPDGDSISAVAQTLTTTHGNTVTINANGSFSLQAVAGFRGTDSFTYTDEDSYGAETSGMVTVNNLFTNRAPVTVLETVNANNASTASGNVLANDSDPDGDAITAVAQTIATADGGTVTVAANGSFTYTAATGFRGNDSFNYTAKDSYGATTAGTVDVNNVFTDRPPVAVNDSYNVGFQSYVSGNVLTNDSDPDGDALSVTAQNITTANGGQVTLNSNGTFTYQAPAGYIGADSFGYNVSDPYGETATATVTLNILGIDGTSGNDSLVGTGNNEPIYGLAGNDTLSDGGYKDTLIGGTGNDSYIVNNINTVITENAGEGTDGVSAGVSYTLGANVENLTLAGSANLAGTGNTLANVITGNSGNDTLNDGGAGGTDTLAGNSTGGNDTFVVNNASDIVSEAHSGTALVKSSANWTLGANINKLTLTAGSIQGTGNSSTDILSDAGASVAADTLVGESSNGSDTFIVNNSNDTISEAHYSSNAALVIATANVSLVSNIDDLTFTGTGNLSGIGNYATDILTSNSGIDTLVGRSLIGTDTFVVNNVNDVVTETYDGSQALVEADVNLTLGTHIANLILEGSTNLTGTGNNKVDTITGNTGNDVLVAGSGNAYLIGHSSVGDDTFVVNSSSDNVTETNSGNAVVEASANFTLGTNNTNELILTAGSLKGTGNSNTDILSDDGIGGGADTLVGESSNGSDTFLVNNSNDTVSEAHYSSNTALVKSTANFSLVSNVDDLTFTGTANLSGLGNYATDILTSNTGTDTLVGRSLVGTDTFVVNNANDVVTETYDGSSALAISDVNWTLGTHFSDLTLTASGITGTGNNKNDTITDDGSYGGDTLVGGTGADDFVLAGAAAYNSIDVLQNFSTARSDKIDISELMSAAGYHSGTSTLADFVQSVNSGSNSLLQVDTTGTGSHFQTVATITGVTSINVATYVSNGNLVV